MPRKLLKRKMKVYSFNIDVITEPENNDLIENKGRIETIVNEIDKEGLTDRNYKQLAEVCAKLEIKTKTPLWKEIMYIIFRPPLTASFMGFIVGFITVIKLGIFDKTTIAFV